jgi:hypothetical protein
MKLVTAILYLCITGGQCETHQVRIEPRACGSHYSAEVSLNGAWQAAKIAVKC